MTNVKESVMMFSFCENVVGGAGTTFDWGHTEGEYARIDGGPDNPGYFTYKEAPTSMGTITANKTGERIYDLQGNRRENVRKGLNIIVTAQSGRFLSKTSGKPSMMS